MYKKLIVLVLSLVFLTGCGDNYAIGDEFFRFIHQNKPKEAFNMTSPEFRQSTTFDGFQYTIDTYELTTLQKILWTESSFEDFQGSLVGTLTFFDGRELEVTLNLVKTNDQWKIISIEFSNPNLTNDANLPDLTVIRDMINQSIWTFFDDVEKGNFNESYKRIAENWKLEISRDRFTESFQAFLNLPDERKNFDFLRTVEPQLLTQPQISNVNEKTILSLQGQYAGENRTLLFDLKYLYEEELWKLTGIKISIQ